MRHTPQPCLHSHSSCRQLGPLWAQICNSPSAVTWLFRATQSYSSLSCSSSLNTEADPLVLSTSPFCRIILNLCTFVSPVTAVCRVSSPSGALFGRESSVGQCSAWSWPKVSKNSRCGVIKAGQIIPCLLLSGDVSQHRLNKPLCMGQWILSFLAGNQEHSEDRCEQL